jgi:2-oxo-4-hydroxy-4-carboxy--5-ureidoimidazoline (OHCU) decarboxylase
LIDLAESVCLGTDLTEQDKLDIINAHPRIGENKTNLSAMSLKEQGYNTRQGSESEQDRQVNATLAELNKVRKWTPVEVEKGRLTLVSRWWQEYENTYGFKFVIFVAGRPRSEIIPLIRERIASNNKEQEMKTGMTDMMLIARDRLKKATGEAQS